MATEKQKKVIKKISENIRNKKVKNKGEILDESGYSKDVTKRPSQVYESKAVKEALKPLILQLEQERQAIIIELKKKRNKAMYNHLISGLDILTKNIQLLSGEATEKKEIVLTDDLMDKIAKERANRAKVSQE